MLTATRKRQRSIARTLAAAFAALWFTAAVAPCAMAAQVQPQSASMGDCMQNGHMHASNALFRADCCYTTVLDCRLPNPNPPSAPLNPDVAARTPMVLHTLPPAVAVSTPVAQQNYWRDVWRTPVTSLNLQHGVFLI